MRRLAPLTLVLPLLALANPGLAQRSYSIKDNVAKIRAKARAHKNPARRARLLRVANRIEAKHRKGDQWTSITPLITARWAMRNAGSAGWFGSTEPVHRGVEVKRPGKKAQHIVFSNYNRDRSSHRVVPVVANGPVVAEARHWNKPGSAQTVSVKSGGYVRFANGTAVHGKRGGNCDSWYLIGMANEGQLFGQTARDWRSSGAKNAIPGPVYRVTANAGSTVPLTVSTDSGLRRVDLVVR